MFISENLVEIFIGTRDFVEHTWVFAAFHPGGLVGKVVEGEAAAGLAAAHDPASTVGCGTVGRRIAEESYKNVMRQAQGNGYRVHLWFVGTRSAEVNLDRVRRRFFKGGHDVPKKDIVKRYEGGCERLKGYIELADEARIYDNSIENAPEPRLVLRVEKGEIVESVPDIPRWVQWDETNKA